MKIEPLHAGEHVVLTPAIRGTVGAAHEQAVQDGEEHRALQRELMPPRAGEIGNHVAAAGLFPQPLEHQHTSAGPMRRTAILIAASSATALSIMALAANRAPLGVDVLELRIAVGMFRALVGLAVRLPAVAERRMKPREETLHKPKHFIVAAALLVGVAVPAGAQQPSPPPTIPYGPPIELEAAKKVMAAAEAEVVKNNWPMAIVILDSTGHIVMLLGRLNRSAVLALPSETPIARNSSLPRARRPPSRARPARA